MLDVMFLMMSSLLLPMLTKKYWHFIVAILMVSSLKMLLMMNNSSLVSISPMLMMDQMSATLIMLSMWITALMMLASYKIFNAKNMPKMFSSTCLILLMTLVVSFSSSSMMMFYIAFEASLIPTMMLIMLWGYQPERMQASLYLMIYTITASLPLLMMILKMYYSSKHLNMTMPEQLLMPTDSMSWMIWMMMITAFMVKLPLFSVHLWLPKAHVEAPVAGSMILAAVLLKLGGYGLTRMIMIFSYMNKMLINPLMSIAMVGGVITSMICLRQSDMKSMIAYSSVGHMGLMVAGVLTGSKLGVQAGLAMMIAHGMSSSAMFCMANINYGMTQTRSITLTKGMLTVMPILSLWWFLFCCANMAAPPSINLMSEIMLIMSIMSHSPWIIIPLGTISFVTVAYSLYLYSATNHGSTLSMTAPMPSILPSDMMLLTLHIIPILALMLKPEIIMSWC